MDDISALRSSLALWDALGDLCAFLALLGVILIALSPFRSRPSWSWPPRLWYWPKGTASIGAVMVIAGLAGEILAARSSRNINERIAAMLNAQAAAATEASKAAEKEAAQLRLQLARLKWRVISPEQQAALVEWLKKTPKGPVLVLYRLDDEPQSFATQIRDALKAAGFDPKLEQSPATLSVSGTFLLVEDLEHPPAHAVAIQKAFREIHVDLDAQQDARNVPDGSTVVILVGSRRL
jgi:hypothetical protein